MAGIGPRAYSSRTFHTRRSAFAARGRHVRHPTLFRPLTGHRRLVCGPALADRLLRAARSPGPAAGQRARPGRRHPSQRLRPSAAARVLVAQHRAVRAGRAGRRPGRASHGHAHLLRGLRDRRAVEDDQQRDHLRTHLRQLRDALGGRARDRALEPGHHLGRDRRGQQSAELVVRGRHVQVRGRRQDFHARGTARDADHRARNRASRRRGRGLGGGQRPPVRPQSGARRLQDHGRGPVLEPRPQRRREHRRHRPGHRSLEPQHALRGHLSAAPDGVLLRGRRARQRHLALRRRRRELEPAERQRPSARHHGARRAGDDPGRSRCPLRADRGRGGQGGASHG